MNFFDDLKNKKILVVGASQGIGKQVCIQLNKLGSKIYALARNKQNLKNLSEQIDAKLLECDINIEKQVVSIANEIDPIDGICFIAGFVKLLPPKFLMKKTIEPQFTTNIISPLSFLGEFLRKKKINDKASIIFTSASARMNHPPCSVPYASAKMGLIGASKALVKDLSFSNKMRFNVVSYDYVETEMVKNMKVNDKDLNDKDIISVSPVEHTATPYIFLLSSRSKWINGQIIAADAGRMLSKTRYV